MKLAAALGWTTAGTVVSQASGLLRLLIVTAAVTLEDLGVYAIAASLAAAAGLLGDSGLRQLYLSRRANAVSSNPADLLAIVWTGMVAASVAATMMVGPLAFMASRYLGEGAILWMAIAISACSTVATLQNRALLFREASGDFGPSTRSESIGQLVALGVVALLVTRWPSVWLLVVGQAIAAAGATLASYAIASPARGGTFRLAQLLALAKEGRAFVLIAIATYITGSFDKLLLGLMLSPSAAGTFFLAQRLADAPRQLHASVVGRTVLPLYAAAHAREPAVGMQRIARTYFKLTLLIFAAAGIAALAAFFLFGSVQQGRLRAVGTLLPILLVGTGLRAACQVVSPSLVILGQVGLEARYKVQEALAYFVVLALAILAAGMHGAALAFLGIYAIALVRRHDAVRSFQAVLPSR